MDLVQVVVLTLIQEFTVFTDIQLGAVNTTQPHSGLARPGAGFRCCGARRHTDCNSRLFS